MDLAELDREIEELEQRVDRLRSLYEQYFMGIEKLEPLTARKDVDRRIWVLRREQIRNTRRRFRLQTIIQRYNTYQQYWMRINREIEAGTYRRHLIKAQKILENFNPLTAQARKRHRMLQSAADDQRGEPTRRSEAPSELPDLDVPQAGDGPAPEALDADTLARLEDLFGPEPPPAATRPRAGAARRPRRAASNAPLDTMDLEFEAVGGVLQASVAPERPRAAADSDEPPTPRRVTTTETAAFPQPPPTPRWSPAGGPLPPPPSLVPRTPSRVAVPPVSLGPPGMLGGTGARHSSPAEPPPAGATPAARPLPIPSQQPRPLPPPPGSPVLTGRAGGFGGPSAPPPVAPSPPQPPLAAPARGAARGVAGGGGPVLPSAAPSTTITELDEPSAGATAAGGQSSAPRGGSLRPPPKPARGRPAAAGRDPGSRPGAAGGSPPRNPSPLAGPPSAELSDARVQAIHARLVEAKRRTADTSAPTVEALRRSLLATQARLRQQHGRHRSVDFEVVIKDGKAVLKPVVK
jgi:hypothetical protein